MFKKFLWLIVLTALFACKPVQKTAKTEVKTEKPSVTTPKAEALVPDDPTIVQGILPNGLKYYIKNNGKPADKVELRLVVNAGSILEDDDQQGLAHFMEHMNFNGTKHFKKNELVDYLQGIGVEFGADLNAYTSFDQTVFILPIPSDDPEKLEKGFLILEDWAFGALLTAEEIDKERGVVLEELRTRLGAENRMQEKYLPKMAYKSRYAKRLPIGKKEILESFTPDKIKRFYKDWYRPDLMAVIAVGDVDVKTLEEKIKKHFGKEPARVNPRERKYYGMQNHKETFVSIVSDKEATFNNIRLMYIDEANTQTDKTLDGARKTLVQSLFAEMINNRLDELRNSEKPPFVYGFSYKGGFLVKDRKAYQSIAMASANPMDALKALVVENERVKRYGFQAGELKRAKSEMLAQIEKQYLNRNKVESKRLVRPIINQFLDGRPNPSLEWKKNFFHKELPTISLQEVNALVNQYLRDENRVVIVTGKEPNMTEQEVLDLLASVGADKSIQPYEDKEVQSSLFKELPKKGSIVKTEKEALGITKLTLSNGARVFLKKTDFKDDEILFSCVSKGGSSLFSLEDYKKAHMALGGVTEAGVAGLSKNDLNKFMTGKIARVHSRVRDYSEEMEGSATPKDLETLMQLIYLNFTSINKDKAAYESFISKQKGFLANVLGNPQYYFMDKFGRYIHEGDPRYSGIPTPEDYDNADYDLAFKLRKERFANAGDFDFYFVGNFDENKIKPLIEQFIASLPASPHRENYQRNTFMPVTGSHKKIFYKGTEPKSQVSIVFYGRDGYDKKDALAVKALGDILRIKLIEKLREKESGIYSTRVWANLDKKDKDYTLWISYGCAPENVEKLNKISLAEVANVAANGPTEKDLHKAKEAFLLDRKEELKKNRFWIDQMSKSNFLGEDMKDIERYDDVVNALTVKDIQRVAQKYFTHGAIIGILMPETEKK